MYMFIRKMAASDRCYDDRKSNSSHGQLVTPQNRVTSWPYCFYSAPRCSHCKRCTSYGNSNYPL